MAIVGTTNISISNALYTLIREGVYGVTKRQDLVIETAIAIRKATMKLHSADLWKSDLIEVTYVLPVLNPVDVSFRYSVDLTDQLRFYRYRKISHIKEYNAVPTGQELQFAEVEVDRVLDSYLLETINYWYQAGQQVSLRTNKMLTNLRVGFWRYPDIIPATYDSWIARQFPDAIIEEAAAAIFKMIGKDNEAATYRDMFNENLHLLQVTQI